MDDTTGPARDRYHELLRAMPAYERVAQANALSKATREMALAGIRSRFPTADDAELRVRLAVRLYGRELARRLFGDAVPANAV